MVVHIRGKHPPSCTITHSLDGHSFHSGCLHTWQAQFCQICCLQSLGTRYFWINCSQVCISPTKTIARKVQSCSSPVWAGQWPPVGTAQEWSLQWEWQQDHQKVSQCTVWVSHQCVAAHSHHRRGSSSNNNDKEMKGRGSLKSTPIIHHAVRDIWLTLSEQRDNIQDEQSICKYQQNIINFFQKLRKSKQKLSQRKCAGDH